MGESGLEAGARGRGTGSWGNGLEDREDSKEQQLDR